MPKITRKELKIIFIELKNILKKYHKGSIYSKYNKTDRYELWSRKDIIIAKRSRKEIFFASIIIQSNYVGLYYMPIYVDSSIKKVLSKELLSMLHGKSCFYIKSFDKKTFKQVDEALKIGYKLYEKRGWIKND